MTHRPSQFFKHLRDSYDDGRGFAMLFTILIVSLILMIAIGISDITLKQTILSNLAKDSGIAFYQADAAVECGMYEDVTLGKFSLGATHGTGTSTDVPGTFSCGNVRMTLNPTTVRSNYFEYDPPSGSAYDRKPCFSIIFDKSQSDGLSRVDGSGFNLCNTSPRQVERLLEVKY